MSHSYLLYVLGRLSRIRARCAAGSSLSPGGYFRFCGGPFDARGFVTVSRVVGFYFVSKPNTTDLDGLFRATRNVLADQLVRDCLLILPLNQ